MTGGTMRIKLTLLLLSGLTLLWADRAAAQTPACTAYMQQYAKACRQDGNLPFTGFGLLTGLGFALAAIMLGLYVRAIAKARKGA